MSGLVCAHRGASLELPDNSMAAFAAAIASGCDMIETDVRLAADGRLVLAHDTWDVVDGVAELAALLELADGRVGLDLEIVELGLERPLLDAVDGFSGPLLITSTYAEVLAEVRDLAPHLDTGLVVEAPYDGSVFTGDAVALARACGASTTLVEDAIATDVFLAAVDSPLWVWTVNDHDRLAELLAHPRVTGVITDDPALARGIREAA
ncbi:glycerophosphodiester phosphodiesterase [Jatrophihabitans fulvus]